jgi:serine/threonine protein kinase
MSDLTGKSFGHYRILEPIGQGGMAMVYKALDTHLNCPVAIKVIRTDQFAPSLLDQVLKRFEREADALSKLSHPNIVHIHDHGQFEGAPYLVLEYIPGEKLTLQPGTPWPWQAAVKFVLPVAQALAYAHKHKIIHRDVKPSNILITGHGRPMLTDFGIARIVEDQESTGLTGTGVGIGTPEYMAPEQRTGKAGPLVDQYALAVVLYEMVTGRKPYPADTPAGILPRPGRLVSGLPERLEQVLMQALARDPAQRFPYMGAFVIALEELVGGPSAELNPPAPVSQPARPPGLPMIIDPRDSLMDGRDPQPAPAWAPDLPMVIDPRDSLVERSKVRWPGLRLDSSLSGRRSVGIGVVVVGTVLLGLLGLVLLGKPRQPAPVRTSTPVYALPVSAAIPPTLPLPPTRTMIASLAPSETPFPTSTPTLALATACQGNSIDGIWKGNATNDKTSAVIHQVWTLVQKNCYVYRVTSNGGLDFQGGMTGMTWYFMQDGGTFHIDGYLTLYVGATQRTLSGKYSYSYCENCAKDSYTVYLKRPK